MSVLSYFRRNPKYRDVLQDLDNLGYKADLDRSLARYDGYLREHASMRNALMGQIRRLDTAYRKKHITQKEFGKGYEHIINNFEGLMKGKVKSTNLFGGKKSLTSVVERELRRKAAVVLFIFSMYLLSKSSGLTGAFAGGFGDVNALVGFLFLIAGAFLLYRE